MVAQPLSEFLNDAFLEAAAAELDKRGFITDEHDFAPYRETLSVHIRAIETALNNTGYNFKLLPSFLKHAQAGYAFFIYDLAKFRDEGVAKKAVTRWLDQRYKER